MSTSNQAAAAAPTAAGSSFTPAAGEHLLEAARRIGPLVREHADQGEENRRLAKPVLDALRAAGLQRMFTPRSLGGFEVDPLTCARVVEEIASHDSAAAWALQAGNTGAWWCARLPQAGVDEVFAG